MVNAGDGASVGDHMAVVRRRRGETVEDAAPELPTEVAYLWLFWCELHAARGCGMQQNPISWPDIDAFSRVTKERLEPWEARAIRAVDDAYYRIVIAGAGGTV